MVRKQKRQDVHTVYELVNANQAEFPVQAMCCHLNVSTSGYYAWRARAPSQRAVANAVLARQIREVFTASFETYGMPRVRAQLAHQGRQSQPQTCGPPDACKRPAWCQLPPGLGSNHKARQTPAVRA